MESSPAAQPLKELRSFRQEIDAILFEYCNLKLSKAGGVGQSYIDLWEAIRQVMSAGGKRIRPYLITCTYQGWGGANQTQVLQAAAAWELLHIGMLVHDDIIDRDYIRHGQENVAGILRNKYLSLGLPPAKSNHYAASGALLAGDLLLTGACQMLGQAVSKGFNQDVANEALHILDEALFAVVGGELLDTESAIANINNAKPELIADLKTASYSMVGPLVTGAVLGGAPKEDIANLRLLGRELGIGYQLLDDLLGVFGDPNTTGKSITSDLTEKKFTCLIQEAYNNANKFQHAGLDHLLGSDITTEVATNLRDLLIKTGAKDVVTSKICKHRDQSLKLLDSLSINAQGKQRLEAIIGFALGRNS